MTVLIIALAVSTWPSVVTAASAAAASDADSAEPAVIRIKDNVVQPGSDPAPDDFPQPIMVDRSGTAEDTFTVVHREVDGGKFVWGYGTNTTDDPSTQVTLYPGDEVPTQGEPQIVISRYNVGTEVVDLTYVLTYDVTEPGPQKPMRFAARAADCIKGRELTPIVVSVTNPAENPEASGTTFPGVRATANSSGESTGRDFYIRDISDGETKTVNLGIGADELGMPDGEYRVPISSLEGKTIKVLTVRVDCFPNKLPEGHLSQRGRANMEVGMDNRADLRTAYRLQIDPRRGPSDEKRYFMPPESYSHFVYKNVARAKV